MSFEADEEILQDFLVEAGEILEQLGEQLIEMEQRPNDADLLNAIFRGFHTVKGGAGFLQLTPLVDCCHVAENVFDILRNNQRTVSTELMDYVLQALDAVNDMFAQVSAGEMPEPADPALIEALHYYAKPQSEDDVSAAPAASSEPVAEEPAAGAPVPEETISEEALPEETAPAAEQSVSEVGEPGSDITDSEYEELLDALNPQTPDQSAQAAASKNTPESTQTTAPTPSSSSDDVDLFGGDDSSSASDTDEITEDEFEALLDQLHGKGKFGGAEDEPPKAPEASTPEPTAAVSSSNELDGDEITDDEFEALLDNLHGKGKFTGAVDNESESESKPAAAPKPAESKEPKKVPEPPKPPETSKPAPAPAAAPKPSTPNEAIQPAAKAPPAPAAAPRAPAAGEKPGTAVAQEATVRVDTKRLDDIMNMVGELVLVRNRLVRLGGQYNDEGLQKAVANLDVVTADLQTSVMKTRMQPIKKVFGRFPRVVRDLARNLKKEVNLELIGEETDLDKNLVEALADPLVHLVRNSVDHGVESPDVRESKGKPRTGKIVLSAQQEGDHILLTIEDDGAGMDAEKLKGIAVERGVMDQDSADRLSPKECFNLIFAPGFSTKTEISDVSGRGVGMDVVKTKISQLNGTVDIESELDKGTRMLIKVPLTLAIMPTLMVVLGEQAFALPLVNVNEIFHLDISKTNVVDGKEVVVVRGKPLPLFHLKSWLVPQSEHELSSSAHVVVVSVGTQRVGFVVDQLVGQEEVVIKPLGRMLHGTPGMSGATITGDGRIALILDVPSMLKYYA